MRAPSQESHSASQKLAGRPPLFFKNLIGSAVGDILMTILLTAKENGLEPVQYLAHLLEFESHRKECPEAWLPWNYASTVKELQASLPAT